MLCLAVPPNGKREGLGGQSQKWNQQNFKNHVKDAGFEMVSNPGVLAKKVVNLEAWKHVAEAMQPHMACKNGDPTPLKPPR